MASTPSPTDARPATVADLHGVWGRGFRELELVKRASLCGTGTCQGSACMPHVRAFLAARAVQPGMKAAGGGVILNLSSINAFLGPAGMPAYVAAKGAVNALTKALAREWGPDNIRVNAISPGWVVTERQLALWLTPEAEAAWMEQVALKARIQPSDIADLALFLASDQARRITGQNHVIDGGRT